MSRGFNRMVAPVFYLQTNLNNMEFKILINTKSYSVHFGDTITTKSIYLIGFTKEWLDHKGEIEYASYKGFFVRSKFKNK